jgi:excisionase family DNA binding protein
MSVQTTGLSREERKGARSTPRSATMPAPGALTITVAHFKALSSLSHTTTYALIKKGKLRTVKIGGRTLIFYDSVKKLFAPEEAPI